MKKTKFKELNAIKEKMINDKGFKKRGMNKGKYLRQLTGKINDFIISNKLIENEDEYYDLLMLLQEGIVDSADRQRERRKEVENMTIKEMVIEKDTSLKPIKFKKRK